MIFLIGCLDVFFKVLENSLLNVLILDMVMVSMFVKGFNLKVWIKIRVRMRVLKVWMML